MVIVSYLLILIVIFFFMFVFCFFVFLFLLASVCLLVLSNSPSKLILAITLKGFTVSGPPPSLSAGGTTFSPKFGKGSDQNKNECLVGLKELLSQIFAWRGGEGGLLCFLSKKTL